MKDEAGAAQVENQPKRRKRTVSPLTGGTAAYSIPEAGAMVGLSRQASYHAANKGVIPIVELSGQRKIVPKAIWNRKLGIE